MAPTLSAKIRISQNAAIRVSAAFEVGAGRQGRTHRNKPSQTARQSSPGPNGVSPNRSWVAVAKTSPDASSPSMITSRIMQSPPQQAESDAPTGPKRNRRHRSDVLAWKATVLKRQAAAKRGWPHGAKDRAYDHWAGFAVQRRSFSQPFDGRQTTS